jgi:protein-L-isoaspartate(D-aspartate) O-methyltransferase
MKSFYENDFLKRYYTLIKKTFFLFYKIFILNLLYENIFSYGAPMKDINAYQLERNRMVEKQLLPRGIADSQLIEAMKKIPRHLFVPPFFHPEAYTDGPLPIGEGQTISQPYIVAYMVQKASLGPNACVLDVGTGSGYQAAVLAEICKEVYTIEIIDSLAQKASSILQDLGYKNIHFKIGDGYQGWPDYAPFDAIFLAAAVDHIPPALISQLKPGGCLLMPLGNPRTNQTLIKLTKTTQGIEREELMDVRFVPVTRSPS